MTPILRRFRLAGFPSRIALLAGVLAISACPCIAAEVQRINPPGVFPNPNFSRAVVVKGPGTMIFISGQTPSNPIDNSCVAPGDFPGQYVAVMESLKTILQATGATFDDVVQRRTFVTNRQGYLAALQSVGAKYWSSGKQPVSTTIQVSGLSDPCYMIEIDLVAVVD